MKKTYCLVVPDDFSRFPSVFFLASKDETAGILKTFISGIENLIDLKVKIIRSDNGIEFKNRIMNEFYEMKARTMLADSKLPTTSWAEVVNTDCYVQNRVLVIKPYNKTPCELFLGRKPALGFMRPFGCPVTILNTLDHLGKFDGKADEGFFVGYSTNSKAFRVFNSRTRIIEENLHVRINENAPNMIGSGPNWLFDLDSLTKTMNYQPVFVGNQTNSSAANDKKDDDQEGDQGQEDNDARDDQDKEESVNSINILNAANSKEVNDAEANTDMELPNDPNMPPLEDIVYSKDEDDVGAEADITNLDSNIPVSPIPTTKIHKDRPLDQLIGDVHSVTQTRRMSKIMDEHGLSLVDLPNGKRAIGTKWVYRNKKDERGIVVRNKARLVAQGHTHEEGIDYDEVFAPVARIEEIRLFLAYASFMDFTVYQMDVKSAFLYGTIEEEVYVCQPPGFEDPQFPDKISSMGELTFFFGLQVKQKDEGIFISQDKYVAKILNKFDFTSVKTASTPMETNKALVKDSEAEDVDVHLYRSMIGSLMYLITSRPDIMFDVCACARFQVTPKVSHLHAVKRIFRYLKGQPKLGLWYPKDSPFDLESYLDSDYAEASLDRKSTTGDSYEKRLIEVLKIHTDHNVADLLTKGFDVSMFNFLIASIGGRPSCQEAMGDIHAQTSYKLILLSKDLKLLLQVNGVRHNLMLMEVNAVRHILTTFNDEGRMDCLPNATIFEEIARMGYDKLTFYKAFFSPQWKFLIHTFLQCLSAKITTWNEISSIDASAIICLSTNQQFNFSKYILEGMIQNLDAKAVKFL
ncbi:putative ribonuclease H-like domain-containing protein, partial [Tanacetum coccineum]